MAIPVVPTLKEGKDRWLSYDQDKRNCSRVQRYSPSKSADCSLQRFNAVGITESGLAEWNPKLWNEKMNHAIEARQDYVTCVCR